MTRLAGVPFHELNDKIYKEVADLLQREYSKYDFMLHTIADTIKCFGK